MLNQGLARYFSATDLARLGTARVGIAGAGGLGSNCAMLLARSGIKRLIIVDFDTVDASNLNRQFYLPEDIGRPKVAALGERLWAISPDLNLTLVNHRLSAENAPEIFKNADVVVEALDNAECKAALINALASLGCHIVGASGLGGIGGPAMGKKRLGEKLVVVGDFSSEVNDNAPPLAPRVMQAAALEAETVLEIVLSQMRS
ncbi:sulfur carrier protein ThiS adenylyltransferase ThiF [Desulfosarcina sp. OttesenSCG-928-B08]|nr:sulfur carrier protein ThiS adenylyltransferase ThiF [Desulfosarcina sp. OttesenSCG-928-B08]